MYMSERQTKEIHTWWLMASSEAEEKFCLARDMVYVCVVLWGESGGKELYWKLKGDCERVKRKRKKKSEKRSFLL